jgi:hypothetical protein
MSNGDEYNNGRFYVNPDNETGFVDWCRSVSCHAIFQVPGEIDNPSMAAWEVSYTENVLHFQPAYWEIGDEPALWTHFQIPWDQWTSSQSNGVDATTYAQLVHRYIAAMFTVDPNLNIIGLPGVGDGASQESDWISATVATNGPNLAAISIHVYPAGSGNSGTDFSVHKFFDSLESPGSFLTRVPAARQEIQAACPSCSGIKILVDEAGSGSGGGGNWQTYMQGYPQIPYVAAELIQAMSVNVSNFDLFALQSSYVGSLFDGNGIPHPLDSLYTGILSQFDSVPLTTSISGPVDGIYSMASQSGDGSSLTTFAVNTNVSSSVTLRISDSLVPSTSTYSAWWSNLSTGSTNQIVQSTAGTGDNTQWSIPPEGVLLVKACQSTSFCGGSSVSSVTFTESGLPAGTSCIVTCQGSTLWSTTNTIIFGLANGSYPFQLGAVPGYTTNSAGGPVTVRGLGVPEWIVWTPFKYSATFTETGLPSGTNWSAAVQRDPGYSTTNSIVFALPNGTYSYNVTPIPGYAANSSTGSFTVAGGNVPVNIAWTPVTYLLTFRETGLPGGNWNVTIGSTQLSSAAGSPISFALANGTYGYQIGIFNGYATQDSGSARVTGGNAQVDVPFAQLLYSVKFSETGLPTGSGWSVTIGGAVVSGVAGQKNVLFFLSNGTYSYQVGAFPGYRTHSLTGMVIVNGKSIAQVEKFTQVKYAARFFETGLPTGTTWNVTIGGTTLSAAAGSPVTFVLPNGTYAYRIGGIPGYKTLTLIGSMLLNGKGVALVVKFTQAKYVVKFVESGLPLGTNWTVTSGGSSKASTTRVVTFVFANGTYSYQIGAITGYTTLTSAGSVTVNGVGQAIAIKFTQLKSVVRFVEKGLPAGTNWSVTIGGTSRISKTSAVAFSLGYGTWFFIVNSTGYASTPPSGNATVNGTLVTISIAFVKGGALVPLQATSYATGLLGRPVGSAQE